MKKSIFLAFPLLLLAACAPAHAPTGVPAPAGEEVGMAHAEEAREMEGATQHEPEAPAESSGGMAIDESATVFELTGENMKFMMEGKEAPELRVKQGDTVVIRFTTTSGFHDWVLDEFNAATDQVGTGDSSSVTFVADKKGEFEYYCSVGNHRAMGMKGKLIVE